jgi:hypothetical protein
MKDLKAIAESGDPQRIAMAIAECEAALSKTAQSRDALTGDAQTEAAILSGAVNGYLAQRSKLDAEYSVQEQQLGILRKRHAEAIERAEVESAARRYAEIKRSAAKVPSILSAIDEHFAAAAKLLGELSGHHRDITAYNTAIQNGTIRAVGPVPMFPTIDVPDPRTGWNLALFHGGEIVLPRLSHPPGTHWPAPSAGDANARGRALTLEEINHARLVEHRQNWSKAMIERGWRFEGWTADIERITRANTDLKVKRGMAPHLAEVEARREAEAEVWADADRSFVPLTELPDQAA